MGFDCGFDISPRLKATAINKNIYQRFVDEVIDTYKDVRDEKGVRADGKILAMPTDSDAWDNVNIWFMVGECPHLPSNPIFCSYFLRFSSKISGRLTTPAEPYIRSVYQIARRHFGDRVHFWHEMNETNDERQHGCYDWQTVHEASQHLKEVGDLINHARQPKATSPTSLRVIATPPRDGTDTPQSPDLVQGSSIPRSAVSSSFSSSSPPRIDAMGNIYAIRPVLGRGCGLIATSKIHKGARILSEAPLFKVPRDEPDIQALNGHIIRALKTLDKDHQRAFLSLHNAHGTSQSPFLGIARTNVLPLGSGAHQGGLFLEASRINHSCRHNAQNTWNESIGRLTIHALRDIEEGQEITISYLGRRMDHEERQQLLKEKFLFDCRCDTCTLALVSREESDFRLRKIQFIDDTLGDLGEAIFDYDTGLHLVHHMLQLLEEEGIWDAGVPRAYHDAFQIAISNGDEVRAKIFAERSYIARAIVEGDDSPEVARLRMLAQRPTQHWLYRAKAGSSQDAEPPQGTDDSMFNDWLWKLDGASRNSTSSCADISWNFLAQDQPYSWSSDEASDSFDSLSTSSIMAALFRSLDNPSESEYTLPAG